MATGRPLRRRHLTRETRAPMTLAARAQTCAARTGGELEQIQRRIPIAYASLQTTKRYPGTEQNLSLAMNDGLGLEID